MYKINVTDARNDNGLYIKSYGIESEKISFKDLTLNKEKAEKLCNMCNKYNIDENQIEYVIEDFLAL